jgi:ribosome-binding protein aMBF1 (putative translation factor)
MKPFKDFDYKDLRNFRESLGLDYRRFAKTIRYSHSRINQVENHKLKLSQKLVWALEDNYPSLDGSDI